jgi:Fic family protein
MPIKKRMVKGRAYFYLESNLRIGEKAWKTFSVYIGAKKPTKAEMAKLEKRLTRAIADYIRNQVLKPKTQFIDEKTAMKLEKIRASHKRMLAAMGKSGRESYLKRQRESFITNTNAIEGSQLTFEQTRKILELRHNYEARDREELEVINMEQCLLLYDQLLGQKAALDEKTILRMHMLLLKSIPDYEGYAGVWRPVNVYIRGSGYEFPDWKGIPRLVSELLDWYGKNKDSVHPVELAAIFHARFVTIHPFADGNGRMARLLMNYVLQLNGFPFTDIPLSRRDEYFKAQEEGHFRKYKPFVSFLVDEMRKEFTELKKKAKSR